MELLKEDEKKWLLRGFIGIIVFMMPYIVMWDDSFITIHDSLDGIFVIPTVIEGQHGIINFDAELGMMEGIKRISAPMTFPWEVKPLINYIIPGYGGFLVNFLLVHLLAFLGMWFLLCTFFVKNKVVAFFVSLAFGVIPFYTEFGISSAGIPLLLYAFLNLKENKLLGWSYFIIVLYTLYSSLALSGVFVCGLLVLWIIYLWYKEKKPNKHLIFSFLVIVCLYISTNWSLIFDFFGGNETFVSHRAEWSATTSVSPILIQSLSDTLVRGQYHAGAFWIFPILSIFFWVFWKYSKEDKTLFYYLSALIGLIAFIIIGALVRLIPMDLFRAFQFDRFYFIYPCLCFTLLAKACDMLWKNNKVISFKFTIIVAVLCVFGQNREYVTNIAKPLGVMKHSPSFAQFFDKQLFNEIAADLSISQDYSVKVASLGMYPSIASYNGFWSVDGYWSSYPLEYKHKFRRVIESELLKDSDIRSYFDNWGNRCYLFSSELGEDYLYSKSEKKSINNFEINTKALSKLGCTYIFSAVEICNYQSLCLDYVKNYSRPDSFWKIWVYRIK